MIRLIAFHLLNDYSGSPKVLSQILLGLEKTCDITLVTSKGGILDILRKKSVKMYYLYYRFNQNKFITMVVFIYAQIVCFFWGLKYGRNRIFYINTILPVGAAIAAKLIKRPIIYHYHENAKVKGKIYRLLSKVMLKFANKIICVSENQASTLPKSNKIVIIPNAIPEAFENIIDYNFEEAFNNRQILMLCSLKDYKGIKEFWDLAESMPNYNFEIVINDSISNIIKYISINNLLELSNLSWYPRQSNVLPFYLKSAIILNLSDKNKFIETFGLTAIEAIACGRPVICPTVGGISEIVRNGFNGFKIDVQNMNLIIEQIEYILTSKETFMQFCNNSLSLKSIYSEASVINKINDIICTL